MLKSDCESAAIRPCLSPQHALHYQKPWLSKKETSSWHLWQRSQLVGPLMAQTCSGVYARESFYSAVQGHLPTERWRWCWELVARGCEYHGGGRRLVWWTFLCVFEHRSILTNQQTGSYKKDNLPVHSYTVFPALQRDSVRLVQWAKHSLVIQWVVVHHHLKDFHVFK